MVARKVVGLRTENIKRLSLVEITPRGNMVTIAGKNGQGKSTLLDSIAYGIGGKDLIPAKPLRRGKERGSIRVDLGDIIVERIFTGDDSRLVVTSQEGAVFKSPQAMLDKMLGSLSFDPLSFTRMKADAQMNQLRKLVPFDFEALESSRKKSFDERTDVNRQIKQKTGELAGLPPLDETAPTDEVSVTALVEELKRREAVNAEHGDARKSLERLRLRQAERCDAIGDKQAAIIELERQLAVARNELLTMVTARDEGALKLADREREIAALVDADVEDIKRQMTECDGTNAKVRQNRQRGTLSAAIDQLKAKAGELTLQLDGCDEKARDAIASAKLPVEGLGISSDGITLNGLPFEQASQAEQLRVSVAMGLAMNPSLRVMLIREGAFLDEDSLAALAKIADELDTQLWVEVVNPTGDVSVIIEDGHVKGVEPQPEETPAVA